MLSKSTDLVGTYSCYAVKLIEAHYLEIKYYVLQVKWSNSLHTRFSLLLPLPPQSHLLHPPCLRHLHFPQFLMSFWTDTNCELT